MISTDGPGPLISDLTAEGSFRALNRILSFGRKAPPESANGSGRRRRGETPPSRLVRDAGGRGWLVAHALAKSYRGRRVVHEASLAVARGESVGLLGSNGAGKTTIFYMITGLIAADAGAIELDGFDVTHLPMYRRARLGVGYLPQEPSIFRGMTVEENIMAVLELVEPNKQRRALQLDSLLQEFSISRLRKSPAIALSGGERRRVLLHHEALPAGDVRGRVGPVPVT